MSASLSPELPAHSFLYYSDLAMLCPYHNRKEAKISGSNILSKHELTRSGLLHPREKLTGGESSFPGHDGKRWKEMSLGDVKDVSKAKRSIEGYLHSSDSALRTNQGSRVGPHLYVGECGSLAMGKLGGKWV